MSEERAAARGPFTVTVSGLLATVLVFAVAALCVRLGFWQLDRRRQRADFNAAIESRMEGPALDASAVSRDTAGLAYRPIALSGRFDDDRSIVLPGRAYRGSPGVHLLTPLLLDGHAAVLVNRGWVPAPDAATVDLELLDTGGAEQFVRGLVMPFPATRPARAQQDAGAEPGFRRVWFDIDEAALRAQYPYRLADFVVQALPPDAAPAGGLPYPIPLDEPALDPGPHLGYAIQWFSFAAIAIIGWVTLARRRTGATRTRVAPPAEP